LTDVCENCLMSPADRAMRYTTTLERLPGTKARVPVPFDPDAVWGTKRQHHVGGTIDGVRVRGSIRRDDSGWSFSVSLCDRPIAAGDVVSVVISPEGPQRWDLEPDLQVALEASPDAGAFFDSLAQFYRKGYLRWIDATKRRPDVRAERIAEVVRLLNAGVKERPRR
jgi:Bacteriocin-protection, YdeI or OmpD-Associated/Domain of unknown function (DUF1905)